MHRTFDTSTTRRTRRLDGLWDFLSPAAADDLETEPSDSFPDDADRIDVPAPWNLETPGNRCEGTAWYRREFDLERSTRARLTFHGVCHDATVWLDGDRVASHYGGYTPFSFVADLEAGSHELVVSADNARDERSLPKPRTDWYPYGGITRDVVLEAVPETFVADVAVEYDLEGDRADVSATVTVDAAAATRVPVGIDVAGEHAGRTVDVDAGRTAVEFELDLEVDRWSPDDPRLYEVVATVGEGDRRDELRDRIGFRTVEVTDTDILVNGEPVSLRGVNRHEDHPEWGHAQPLRLQTLDLDVIEDAGFNAVRTSHYPNHPRFLDLCDERGLFVIEEIPYWQFDAERFDRPGVLDRGRTALSEMIERDRHHPSVLAWSVTNECANEEAGVERATGELADLARSLDDRPVTLATNQYHPDGHGEDRCLQHTDFVCANAYPGWYSEGSYAAVLEGLRADVPDKPIVFSEFGAGAIHGERTRESRKWSEEYQSSFLADAVETFLETEYVAGFTVWQYCDTRTDPRLWNTRPKSKNNKGIVDEYRRPKEAYRRLADLLD